MYQFYVVVYQKDGQLAYESFYTRDYKKADQFAKDVKGLFILAETMHDYTKD